MIWEERYFQGGTPGYENTTTGDIIYVVKRDKWCVVVNGSTLEKFEDEDQAMVCMAEYISIGEDDTK